MLKSDSSISPRGLRWWILNEAGLRGHIPTSVTGIDGVPRLDEQNLGFFLGVGAMLDTAWDDEDLAGAKLDVAITQVDRQPAADDKEEVPSVSSCLCQTNGPRP